MKILNRQSGFTAIELLITLFVAAGFLVAGYQLFNVIIKDGGQARAESRAGNVAYDYIRRYASQATDPCQAQIPVNNAEASIDGLTNTRVTVSITCPEYSTTSLSRIEVTLTYNTPQQTVKYGTYVNGSGTQVTDITDGLIGWWKLNGNANTSVGTINGTVFNAPATTGQNGIADQAYGFSGSNSYVQLNSGVVPTGASSFTVSAWVLRGRNNGGYEEILSQWASVCSGNCFYFGYLNSDVRFSDSWPTISAAGAGVVGSWMHIVGVNDIAANNAYIYINGTLVATKGSRLTYTSTGNSLWFARQGEYAGGAEFLMGSIDDVRVYNRALSASEVSTIYSGGAK